MHVHFPNDGSSPMPAGQPLFDPARSNRALRGGKATLPWSLLVLGAAYFLLVAGPLFSQPTSSRAAALRWLRDLASGAAWLPAPAAAGVALFGAAALIFVVARLVRDVEQRPYASISPVLAVFSGFVLTSTRAELPLPSVGANQLGLLVLALSVLGGVLISRAPLAERALGWLLALLPISGLLLALTAVLGESDPVSMLQRVDPALRTYLMLLLVSALALAGVGTVARRLLQTVAPPGLDAYGLPSLRLPRLPLTEPQGGYGAQLAQTPAHQTMPGTPRSGAARPAPLRATTVGLPAPAPRHPPPLPLGKTMTHREGPTAYAYAHHTPPVGQLAIDDPDLLLLTRRKLPFGRMVAIAATMICTGMFGAYFFVVRPRAQLERARIRAAVKTMPLPAVAARVASDDAAQQQPALGERAGQLLPSVESLLTDDAPSAADGDAVGALGSGALAPIVTSLGQPSVVTGGVVDSASGAERPQLRPPHGLLHHQRSERPRRHRREVAKQPSTDLETSRVASPAKLPAPVPAAVAKQTDNEHELDLDELVQKALKGGGNVAASDDPILGL